MIKLAGKDILGIDHIPGSETVDVNINWKQDALRAIKILCHALVSQSLNTPVHPESLFRQNKRYQTALDGSVILAQNFYL